MKIGVNLSIDVSKIDKSKLYQGKKGTYLDMTAFIDTDEEGQYGDNGMITQSLSKEERDSGDKGAILGNAKVFWTEGGKKKKSAPKQEAVDFDDDVPF